MEAIMPRKRWTGRARAMWKFYRKCERMQAALRAHIDRQMPFIRPDLYWMPSEDNPNILIRQEVQR
jgi:hypothetical protein